MAKLTVYQKICSVCRSVPFMAMPIFIILAFQWSGAHAQYQLEIHSVDKTDSFLKDTLRLQMHFQNEPSCIEYINRLPVLLQSKGYPSASVDSVKYDSSSARCVLYIGAALRYSYLSTDSIEGPIVQSAGLNRKNKRPFTMEQFKQVQEKILDYMENNGYPFARVEVENIRFAEDSIYGMLKIDKGPLYRIDSIRNLGSGSISSAFLQQYLGIRNNSIYKKERLQDISNRIRELPYLQEKLPWNLSLLGTGSILNVYLDTKKSSEINILLGLLPSSDQLLNNKLLVTGEANINLKNSLGGGETIGLNWQQLQVKSPRLNILFQQPYLFGSPFGMNFNFDLFKKDSSYVNVGIQLGAAYALSSRQTGSVFIQELSSNLLSVDTFAVKSSRRLPDEADISSVNLGVNYEWLTTDYRFNPRKGSEFSIGASAGTKNIKKNSVIIKLVDDADPDFNFNSLYDTFQLKSYQFRIKLNAAHYFPLGRASALKAAINSGWYQSPDIFRNEMFQIGGYKLLRGFDEESIFASSYAVFTSEYRYLLGQNSYLSAFSDFGLTANQLGGHTINNNFLGVGVGMAFETKAGIFNISYATGKRDDQKFNLRQSKIHLGYVNYF